MLVDKYSKWWISIEDVYFANHEITSKADIIRYFQYVNKENESNYTTNIINLNKPIEEIKKEFRKSIKSEINQAIKKHNIMCEYFFNPSIELIDNFCEFHNIFAKNKNIPLSNKSKLYRLKNNILLTKSKYEDNDIVMHLYIHDNKRLTLLYSSTIITDDHELYQIIAKSNKLLHFKDIELAQKKEFNIYDFGGVSFVKDEVAGIDKFKTGFSKNIEKSQNFIKGNNLKGKIILWLFNNLKQIRGLFNA